MAAPFRKSKNVENTGFSNNTSAQGARFANKDGSPNVIKAGLPVWQRISLFHALIRIRGWKFLLIVFSFYTITNITFALLYLAIGVHNLQGITADATDPLNGFQQAFFFSSQTLTTVGYGHISPVGLKANVVASLESFVGILSFAMVTGLLYWRFSQPKAYLKFSENFIVAPHKGQRAIMIRFASYKNNHITDAEAGLTMAMRFMDEGKMTSRFYTLKLEIQKIASLALSWTLVHVIDEESPFYEMSKEEMKQTDFELMYHIKGFDDNFSNIVQQRTSYTGDEMIYGARFLPAFHRSADGMGTVLELDKLNYHEAALVPEPERSVIN